MRRLLAVVAAVTVLACGDTTPPDVGRPVSVVISSSGLGLIVGAEERLAAQVLDSWHHPTTASIEWSSANPAIATVGKMDGTVTAISAGTTTVSVAAGSLRATATVSVIAIAGTIAFTRWTQLGLRTSDVFVFSADRTIRSLRRPDQSGSIAAPAWSSDGTQLAVEVVRAYIPEFEFMDYSSDVYILGAETSADAPWRALTTNGLSKSPSWSPDGKRIAYVQQPALLSKNDIYVVDAAGGEPVRVTQTEGFYGKPRWSPDGARLAFTDYGWDGGEVFIVNADGSGLTDVSRHAAFDADPSWSPDGKRLAFVSDRGASVHSITLDVYVVDVDGRNVTRLTWLIGIMGNGRSDSAGAPAWSPDGRQIAFSSGSAIYVMSADGLPVARLTTPGPSSWDSAPAWKR